MFAGAHCFLQTWGTPSSSPGVFSTLYRHHSRPLSQHVAPQHVCPFVQHSRPPQQLSPVPQQSDPHFDPAPDLHTHVAAAPGLAALHFCLGPQHAELVLLKQQNVPLFHKFFFPPPPRGGGGGGGGGARVS